MPAIKLIVRESAAWIRRGIRAAIETATAPRYDDEPSKEQIDQLRKIVPEGELSNFKRTDGPAW